MRHDRGEADHQQHRQPDRHAEEAVQREAEIDEDEQADGNDIEQLGSLRREEMEGEAAKPDGQHEEDQEIMIGAALLARAPQQELEPDQRGKQKGDIAEGVDRLGQQRVAAAALAIAEDMLAEVHGPHPFDPLLQERGLPRRRFHRRTFRVHLFCGVHRKDHASMFSAKPWR